MEMVEEEVEEVAMEAVQLMPLTKDTPLLVPQVDTGVLPMEVHMVLQRLGDTEVVTVEARMEPQQPLAMEPRLLEVMVVPQHTIHDPVEAMVLQLLRLVATEVIPPGIVEPMVPQLQVLTEVLLRLLHPAVLMEHLLQPLEVLEATVATLETVVEMLEEEALTQDIKLLRSSCWLSRL